MNGWFTMTEEGKGCLLVGLFVLSVVAYPASIFLPRQRCPYRRNRLSLPKQIEQTGDRERVKCRWCDQVWERFSYGGGVGDSGGGDAGGTYG